MFMLLPGALARSSASASASASSTCLRCQLHDVLLRARRTAPSRHEAFSTRPPALQQTEEEAFAGDRTRPYKWRHIHQPRGRIVGNAGKRQRVVSEQLSRSSLDKPTSVVILRDVAGDQTASVVLSPAPVTTSSQYLTAKDIEHAIQGRYTAPADAEVHASILELRPHNSIVDEHTFEELVHTLSKSYNSQQLAIYLLASLEAATGTSVQGKRLKRDLQDLVISQWRPGQTDLARRHERVVQSSSLSKKARIIHQILRLVWKLEIASEEQEVGELEMNLEPWQLRMLFDLSQQDRPFLENLIQSKLLLESTTIEQHQPDGVVRITGRRRDAEDVAGRLKLALMRVKRLALDLSKISPLLDQPGRNTGSSLAFTPDDLRYVSNLTQSIITQEQRGLVTIYNMDISGSNHARRLLLSLLDLSVLAYDGYEPPSKTFQHLNIAAVPCESSSTGLHRRFTNVDFRRLVQVVDRVSEVSRPNALETPGETALNNGDLARSIATRLNSIDTKFPNVQAYEKHEASYWGQKITLDPSRWNAEFCKLLQDATSISTGADEAANESPVIATQHRIPGVDTLLSYAETGIAPRALQLHAQRSSSRQFEDQGKSRIDWAVPHLTAHFIPHTWNATAAKLPRLIMRLTFTQPSASDGVRNLVLNGVKADLEDQSLSVPLPNEAVDLKFTRGISLVAGPEVERDRQIRNFITHVNESIRAGDGVISAPPAIMFHLPRWLVEGSEGYYARVHKDIPVNYLFERFEQVQRSEFAVSQAARSAHVDAGMRAMAESLPSHYRFDYREIEGGAIFGNTTRLALRRKVIKQMPSTGNMEETDSGLDVEKAATSTGGEDGDNDSEQLARSALQIAHLLTRANAGTLLPLRAAKAEI